MWGGGVFVISTIFLQIIGKVPLNQSLFIFDPFGGDWALNWGRNLLYPQEAVYHLISAGTFLCLLKRKWLGALFGAAILASTTPFSGIQLTLSVLASFIFLFFYEKRKYFLFYVSIALTILVLLMGYYFVFLKSYNGYGDIHERFVLSSWILPWNSLLLAYAPLLLLVSYRIVKEYGRFTSKEWLLVIWLFISLVLVKNELFLPEPIQPLHFTRGYIWFPLMLLAMPLLQRWLIYLYQSKTKVFASCVISIFFLVFVFDNLAFVKWRTLDVDTAIYLTVSERKMFSWMDKNNIRGLLLTSDYALSYLSATYTEATPYLGYWNLTPDFDIRIQKVADCVYAGKGGEWVNKVDYVLKTDVEMPGCLNPLDWQQIYQVDKLELLVKKR